ncbi:MAG: dual specificity protein phosphatase family protein [Chloroflexia bacterium]|nr:dual specificity protein phosphatase family protein [Chloroflexia bacterium]
MHRFYWVIDNVMAGCSRPGVGGGDVDRDLDTLRGHGVGALVSLTETALPRGALERHGLLGLHLPVDDFHAPTTMQMLDALTFLDEARATSTPVAVHCLAGQGRTGTVLAAYLIRGGRSAEQAIADLRAICPGAIEASRQTAALVNWCAERPWLT